MWRLLLLLFTFVVGESAHFENLIDLTLKIEDANFNLRMKSVTFNGDALKLNDTNILKPRKEEHFRLPPGRYMLLWSTEKAVARFAQEPLIKNHERILVLEHGDTSIRINIRGDDISLY
jgi:hypothetical protein